MRRLVRSGLRRRAAVVGIAVSLGALAVAGGAASAASGDLDPGFGGASHGRVDFELGGATTLQGLTVQPSGGIVTVGTGIGGGSLNAVAFRLHADGTPDSRFGTVTLPGPTDATERARAVVAQPDGKVVVVGDVTDAGGFRDIAVWRLTSTGALDASFGTNGLTTCCLPNNDELALDIALDPQGRIVVTGFRMGVDLDIAVARFTPDGLPDPTFNNGSHVFAPLHTGSDDSRSVAVQADGQIIAASHYAGVAGSAVLRITPGTATTEAVLDPGFGGGDGIADVPGTLFTNNPDVTVGVDGKILLLSQVPTTGGSVDGTVVRLTTAGTTPGSVDDSFGSATGAHIDLNGGNETLHALTVLPHGGIAVVGDDGLRSFVAKLRPTGVPDLGIGPAGVRTLPGPAFTSTAGVAALPDGRILAMGNADGDTGIAYRLLGDLDAPSCAGKRATIVGTKASDRLVGTRRIDVIAGLGGRDRITGLGKGDLVCGGRGGDHILGRAGADRLYGQAGQDTLSGGKGRDKLVGGAGHDTLKGGPGRDTLRQ